MANMNINKSCRRFMILSLFLRIIGDLLLADSVDGLVPFFNHKIIDCLSFMERMDRLRFMDMMISFRRRN